MPASDVVLLPVCIGLALIGVIVAGVAWRRGNRGRVLQGAGLALAPVALYFTGLLRLLWDAVVAVVGWATSLVFSPALWFGLSLLAVCVVLWVVGGLVTRRSAARLGAATDRGAGKAPAVGTGRGTGATTPERRGAAQRKQDAEIDPELAEIEAILKERGIN